MDLRSAADLARTLAREAGDFAVAEHDAARIEAKGSGSDLVTHVDREAERRIVSAIRERYPDHALLGEEDGEQGAGAGAAYRWLIDPLDGTHNYVLGLDVYGVCITLCEGERPVVAVVHDSPRRRTYWAIAGEGAWLSIDGAEDRRLRIGEADELARTTISFTQGYEVGHDDARRNVAFAALERGTKRLLRSWAPSSDWGLLATGHLGAMVAYRNEIWDRVGGTLLAQEAGAEVLTDPTGDLIIVGIPQIVQQLGELLAVNDLPPVAPAASPFTVVPEAERIAANHLAFAIRDAHPVSPGHALIIPVRQITTWFEATADEQRAAWDLVDEVRTQLDASLAPDGYNVGFNSGEAAGQTVFHAHLHVIPRYTGDVEDPTGGVRHAVIGQGYY